MKGRRLILTFACGHRLVVHLTQIEYDGTRDTEVAAEQVCPACRRARPITDHGGR